MKYAVYILSLILLCGLIGCAAKENGDPTPTTSDKTPTSDASGSASSTSKTPTSSTDDASSESAASKDASGSTPGLSSSSDGSSSGGSGNGQNNAAGQVTAGEWNDLDNWDFWKTLMTKSEFLSKVEDWEVYPNKRLAVTVKYGGQVVYNVLVEVKLNSKVVWQTRTDNLGRAEVWLSPFAQNQSVDLADYTLMVGGDAVTGDLKLAEAGRNQIGTLKKQVESNRVELAFIVDATGSMSDELEFLKKDLENIIERAANAVPDADIQTGSIFYRDAGEAYVTKHSDFSSTVNTTLDFIAAQRAAGGGDFPEAVHTALEVALKDLTWSPTARTRLAFLLLDAPPHARPDVLESLKKSLGKAAAQGIKIIPIAASGIDKKTELLMRVFAMLTNGTYVFITNDSGIGNDHIEASVGNYQVEFLNDLVVRLIKKYSASNRVE